MKKKMKIIIYTPHREFIIEKYIKEVERQDREIEDAEIIEEYIDKIKDTELPIFLIDY
jgi:hypothetical protein